MYSATFPPKMYFLNTSALSVLASSSYPTNLVSLCGMEIPPSVAPFKAAKTLAPVVVLRRPTSRTAAKALGPSARSSTL